LSTPSSVFVFVFEPRGPIVDIRVSFGYLSGGVNFLLDGHWECLLLDGNWIPAQRVQAHKTLRDVEQKCRRVEGALESSILHLHRLLAPPAGKIYHQNYIVTVDLFVLGLNHRHGGLPDDLSHEVADHCYRQREKNRSHVSCRRRSTRQKCRHLAQSHCAPL